MRYGRSTASLTDELPELARGIPESERGEARRSLVVPAMDLAPGDWTAAAQPSGEGRLGLLVVDGFLTREVSLGDTVATELVGRGDVLRPGDHDGEEAPVPYSVVWSVLEPARIVSLDARLVAAAARWPSVLEAVVSRMVRRTHALALHLAICHLRRVDARLLALMWHLADRWGRVEPGGVKVPLRLTHQTLGRLVGAQRPSVTTALTQLSEAGLVTRAGDGTWVVHGDPPDSAALVAGVSSRAASV